MNEFIIALRRMEYCQLGDTYAFIREDDFNEILDILIDNNIRYKRSENSYAGIYMIKILESKYIEED